MRFGKKVEEWNFNELAEYVRDDLLNALFRDGTEAMKSRFFVTFNVVEKWIEANKHTPTIPGDKSIMKGVGVVKENKLPLRVACIITAFDPRHRDAWENLESAVEDLRFFGSARVVWETDDRTSKNEQEAIDQYE